MITNMSAINNTTAATFFYVQVVAEDESEAESFLNVAIRNHIDAIDHSAFLAFTSPAEEEEELETFVFAVYGVKAPQVAYEYDHLHDLYTLPHLTNAPCFDYKSYTDEGEASAARTRT